MKSEICRFGVKTAIDRVTAHFNSWCENSNWSSYRSFQLMYHLIGIYVKYLVQNNKPYSVRDENQYWFIWMFTRTVVQSLVGLAFQVAIMFIDECHMLPIWDMEAAIKIVSMNPCNRRYVPTHPPYCWFNTQQLSAGSRYELPIHLRHWVCSKRWFRCWSHTNI